MKRGEVLILQETKEILMKRHVIGTIEASQQWAAIIVLIVSGFVIQWWTVPGALLFFWSSSFVHCHDRRIFNGEANLRERGDDHV